MAGIAAGGTLRAAWDIAADAAGEIGRHAAADLDVGAKAEILSICNYLELDWLAQRQRINRDQVLSEVVERVVITTTPSFDGHGGGLQKAVCLPLDYLNGWLFGVSASSR